MKIILTVVVSQFRRTPMHLVSDTGVYVTIVSSEFVVGDRQNSDIVGKRRDQSGRYLQLF